MSPMRPFRLVLAALALSGCATQQMPSLTAPALATGSAALESSAPTPLQFTVKRYPGGEPHAIASDRGSVVLLDVWATWCTPCKDTLPVYSQLAREYGERGLKVYALSVDEDVNLIGPFLEQNRVTLPVLLDKNAAVAEGALGVSAMPTAYLIDRRGVVRKVHEGTLGDTGSLLQQYRGQIEALLAEEP
jgi:thiol-disulfide isomerase/thioredoxin